MELGNCRSMIWVALLVCSVSVSCGCAGGTGEASEDSLESLLMNHKIDARVVATFHKTMSETPDPDTPLGQRRPSMQGNRENRPLTSSFGSEVVERQDELPRPAQEKPSSPGNFPNFVVSTVGNKVQRVSSFVQHLPDIFTTIASTMFRPPRPIFISEVENDRYPSGGAVAYPSESNNPSRGSQRPFNRPAISSSEPVRPASSSDYQPNNPNTAGNQGISSTQVTSNRVPVQSPINHGLPSANRNNNNNPFPIVVVEPSQNQGNVPWASQIPSSVQGGPAIPVASGGATPPRGHVPEDEPFILTNFHTIDPTSNGNRGSSQGGFSNTGNSFQNQRPQISQGNVPPSENENYFPNRERPSGGGNSFNQQDFAASSYPPPSVQGTSSFGGSQNPFNQQGTTSQEGQFVSGTSGVQNQPGQRRPSIHNVVNGIQEFTLDLMSTFRALGAKGNVVFSPISIASLLSLLTLGTRGLSSQEIQVALHLPNSMSSSAHHAQYENILRRLNHESSGVKITTASRLFMEETIPITSTFTTQAAQHYNCSVSLENFRSRPGQTQNRVNQWVEETTQGKITEFITAPFSPETIFVAANTIYFNGQWETPFPEYFTGPRDFDTGKDVIRVPMMTNVFDTLHFYSSEYNLDVTSIPYVGGEFSMVILLPRESPREKSIKLLERQLDTVLVEELVSNMTKKSVSVSLPKMRLTMKSSLSDNLSQLNIKSIFSVNTADFSGLSSRRPMWVSQFLHEAVMEVTEIGTVAAAASGATLDRMGGYQRVNVNKPAIIFIRDNITRLPLFWVRLVKPESIS